MILISSVVKTFLFGLCGTKWIRLEFIYLIFLRHFQHCTGHIMMGSWKGRGPQYIQLVKVLYGKLPINGKQQPAFPLESGPGNEPWH